MEYSLIDLKIKAAKGSIPAIMNLRIFLVKILNPTANIEEEFTPEIFSACEIKS